MDVHLPPELEQIVRSQLQSGRYESASEVVSDALRLMQQRNRVRDEVAQGLESLRQGRGIDGQEAFAQLDARHEGYRRTKRE